MLNTVCLECLERRLKGHQSPKEQEEMCGGDQMLQKS